MKIKSEVSVRSEEHAAQIFEPILLLFSLREEAKRFLPKISRISFFDLPFSGRAEDTVVRCHFVMVGDKCATVVAVSESLSVTRMWEF
jgi:hypothetical protein